MPDALDTGSCADCGRPYGGTARPRWAFRHDGSFVGSVHQMHVQQNGKRYPYWTADGQQSVDAGLFDVWRQYVQGWPPREQRDSDEWFAFLLANEPSTELSSRQQEQLAWWIEGPLKLGHDREAVILAKHRVLVEQFSLWREAVPHA